MKLKGGKKKNTPPYSHIASAIIPSVGIIAVPAASPYFPEQKTNGREQWGPMASILIRAASASELLVPSSTISASQQERDYQRSRQEPSAGRMDASTDDDDEESDEENEQQTRQKSSYAPYAQTNASRSGPISDAERRMLGYAVDDDDSITGTMGAGSSLPKDPKEALTAELSRSMSKKEERSARRTGLTVGRQQVPPLVFDPVTSHVGPTSARAASRSEVLGGEGRSVTTARSSLNDSTTIPMSARSVSFKEPVVYEVYDPPSSHSQSTTTVLAANGNSALERLVLPPPEEYQHNFNALERRNESLNVEVQQWRSSHRSLQRQYEQLLDRLQTSQNLSKQELNDILRQSGYEQTRELDNLNTTLKDRCDQLEREVTDLRERNSQNQNPSSTRELKNENHFLKDYIHRLNAASSEYQALNPPKTLKKEMSKEQRGMQGLPVRGPSPIWLLNRKFLAPLFLCYDEKLHDRETFIKKLQTELRDLHEQVKSVTDENMMLHQRLSRSSGSTTDGGHLSDLDHIKRQAYLVLEENKVLQKQLDLQNHQLTDVQKRQIDEVSTLTRRLLVVESEKTEADRVLETIRIRNEDLRRKYEQIMMDNTHRIHVQEHIYEMSELKRLTDELSEKHAHEMQLLLRRVQEGETGKKLAQLKLTECRSDLERFRGELKAMKKLNRKLQLRVQTFEKKLELQQVKEQHITTMLGKTSDEYEHTKLERDTYLSMAKTKENEMIQIRTRMTDDADKLIQVEERLESYKSKNKERVNEVQEQMKRQHENVKLRCLEHEQRIQQLMTLLNEKQTLVDDLSAEKRNLQVDLETIWQATNADNMRIREQLLDMRSAI